MTFPKGHKLAKGGKRPGAGRPSKAQLAARKQVEERVWQKLEAAVDKVVKKYLQFAEEDPATCRHAVDKLIPTKTAHKLRDESEGPIAVNVVLYGDQSKKAT